MTDEEKKANKSKSSPLGNYLFDGNWVEKGGIKWAFFADKTSDTEKEEKKETTTYKTKKIKEIEEDKIDMPPEKISITELGKQYTGGRYNQPLPPGLLKEGIVLTGRYKIIELYKTLKERNFYQAEDARLETPCIVKELTGDFSSPKEREYYRKRFKEEARLLADLSHANLPKVIDYFIESERCFMVIDYVKGFELETLLNNETIEIAEEQALLWGIDICDVLEYLHNQNPPIIHRDIRPANLFIREHDWSIILFNFNVARRQDAKCTAQIGLMGYAPPEQIAGNPEPRSDIYSLGSTLHHILTGKRSKVPFNFKPIRDINPSISEYTELVIKQALNFNAEERFDNAEEMKEALLDAYEALPEKHMEIEEEQDPLIDILKNLKKGGYKKLKAIKELGTLEDPRICGILTPFLEDESVIIRVNAINALGSLGDMKAIPYLKKIAADNNSETKGKAIKAIERIKKLNEI